ncbi:hypothetical protein EK21DRAFT_115580 [Setomelanomma holmii]|uniref:Uncharacterized protein n=1 Tax=Setomelanomma holmii TaxID=210430 RepID=A0A9P4H420_9PLEO|nr:hypothetical protein EK21DRAFT_115580 [Setomelanomma holmii]
MEIQPQAPAGDFAKRHVSGMLKHMADEESRAKTHEAAAKYKQMFADKKWEPVMAKIRRVAEEDPIRCPNRRRPAPLTPAARPLLKSTAPAPSVALANGRTPPAGLSRIAISGDLLKVSRTRAPSTARERWDATYRGPATPLTPTPTGNAFAGGGFWEQLTPKPSQPNTPVTAVPRSPFSPIVPKDEEARAAYRHVKSEVDAIARTVCASRLSVHSRIENSDDIPKSLVRAKDTLTSAEITLHCLQAPLKSMINPSLLIKLKDLAEDESMILQQYSVKDDKELKDIDVWLQVDEQTFEFTNVLDAQRGFHLMNRNRRKNKLLKLPDTAIQQAWATRILEDAEREVEASGDASSSSSNEDRGYDYSNFLRSIKHEASSSSDLASMAGGCSSMRSSGTTSDGLMLSRETTFASQRSSISPKKSSGLAMRSRDASFSESFVLGRDATATLDRSSAGAKKNDTLASRSREAIFSSNSGITHPESPQRIFTEIGRESMAHSQRSSMSVRQSSDLALRSEQFDMHDNPSHDKRAGAVATSRGLSLLTTNMKEVDEDTSELSPEDKAVRRQGCSHVALNNWAQQLKDMEEAANKSRVSLTHYRQHPVYRHHSQCSSGCMDSWELEKALTPSRGASADNTNAQAFTTNESHDYPPAQQDASTTLTSTRVTGHAREPSSRLPGSSLVFASPRTSQASSHISSPSRSRAPSILPPFVLPPLPSGYKYATESADTPLHDTIRRRQHIRSQSSIARTRKREKDEEEQWAEELKRMEERELARQRKEMGRVRSRSRDGSVGSEHGGGD